MICVYTFITSEQLYSTLLFSMLLIINMHIVETLLKRSILLNIVIRSFKTFFFIWKESVLLLLIAKIIAHIKSIYFKHNNKIFWTWFLLKNRNGSWKIWNVKLKGLFNVGRNPLGFINEFQSLKMHVCYGFDYFCWKPNGETLF
jgi:hypothetical protein